MTHFIGNPSQNNGIARAETPTAACPYPLIIGIGGQHEVIDPVVLLDEHFVVTFRGRCTACTQPVDFDIRHLPAWAADACSAVVRFVAGLGANARILIGPDQVAVGLFEACVTLLQGPEDINRFDKLLTAAKYAAALTHPLTAAATASVIVRRLQVLHVTGYRAATIRQEIEQLAPAQVAQPAEHASITVRRILPNAPVGDEIVVPPGWEVSEAGVRRRATAMGPQSADNLDQVIPAPVLIAARVCKAASSTEYVKLVWNRGQGWRERVVERAQIANTRAIVGLAEFGFPVTSNNAATLVQYLADVEARNFEALPQTAVSDQLGWHGDGEPACFLLRDRLLTGHDLSDDDSSACALEFRGGDDGDEQIAEGFRAAGNLRDWQAAIAHVIGVRPVALAVYAAIAAVMLKLLEAANFIVSFAGPTSQAKTTTLRIGGSLWGCPDETVAGSTVLTFDSTRVFLEHAMGVRCDLPTIIDDTKRARRPEDIAQLGYDATSGRGRGRGTVTGTQTTRTWRTILLVSGEAPLTSFSQDGGTRARVLEYWGSPFGPASAETAHRIHTVQTVVRHNYGLAGPAFVEYLLAHRNDWPTIREDYDHRRGRYEERAGTNSVAYRMAAHLAALELTAVLAHTAGILPGEYQDTIAQLWPVLTAEGEEADRAAVALRYLMSWACAHREEFAHTDHHSGHQPANWAGRWHDSDDYIGFLPHRLDELLQQGGFSPEATRRMWHDRGWTRSQEGRNVVRTRLPGGINTRLVQITRTAIDEVCGVLIDPSPAQDTARARMVAMGPTRERNGNANGNTVTSA